MIKTVAMLEGVVEHEMMCLPDFGVCVALSACIHRIFDPIHQVLTAHACGGRDAWREMGLWHTPKKW
jgi:hypothetical protein